LTDGWMRKFYFWHESTFFENYMKILQNFVD